MTWWRRKQEPDYVLAKIYYQLTGVFTGLNNSWVSHSHNQLLTPGTWWNSVGTWTIAANTQNPGGLQMWGSVYSQFQVLASKISIDYVNLDTAHSLTVSIHPNITNSLATSGDDVAPFLTRRYVRYKMLANAGSQNRGRLRHYMTTNKIVGDPKSAVTTNDDFLSSITNAGVDRDWETSCI